MPLVFDQKHFPEKPFKFFILKTFSAEHIRISIERGVWSTQAHNEKKLDAAFKVVSFIQIVLGNRVEKNWRVIILIRGINQCLFYFIILLLIQLLGSFFLKKNKTIDPESQLLLTI